jgi:uncharacterized protein YlzI (FlbEa/FlbD family)
MQNKFIKVTTESGDEHHINPIFIVEIKKIKSLSESQPDTATVVMVNGDRIRPKETVEQIMKKIKDTENFTIYNK